MSDFSFSVPKGDSASLVLTVYNTDGSAPDLTAWALTFTAGTLTKTSAGGSVSAALNVVTVTINAGDLATAGVLNASLVAASGLLQSTWYGEVAVTDAASRGDLTTLANVKGYLRREFADPAYGTFDVELSRLIRSVSAEVRRATDRDLDVPAASKTDRFDGDGGTRWLCEEYPVTAISSVTVDGVPVPEQPDAQSNGWFLDGDAVELVGYAFTCGRGNVSIVYSAGYSTVPTDLEDAVIQLVALKFHRADGIGQSSLSVNGDTVQFDGGAQFANAMAIVDRYARVSVG
jgi:hypothetical protein